MKCPNCDKKPMSSFAIFSYGNVGIRKSIQGYMRCRHCDTTLRIQKNKQGIAKFEPKYWLYFSISMLGTFALCFAIPFFGERYFPDAAPLVIFLTLVTPLVALLFLLNHLKSEYIIFSPADLNEELPASEQLSNKAIVGAMAFAFLGFVGFVLIDQGLLQELDTPLYLLGNGAYVILLLVIALVLTKVFKTKEKVT